MSYASREVLEQAWIAATPTSVYAPAAGHLIVDKVTTTNRSAAMVDVTAYVVGSGDTYAELSAIKTVSLTPGQCYLWPELVGKTVAIGSSIWFGASVATSVNLGMSGRIGT